MIRTKEQIIYYCNFFYRQNYISCLLLTALVCLYDYKIVTNYSLQSLYNKAQFRPRSHLHLEWDIECAQEKPPVMALLAIHWCSGTMRDTRARIPNVFKTVRHCYFELPNLVAKDVGSETEN